MSIRSVQAWLLWGLVLAAGMLPASGYAQSATEQLHQFVTKVETFQARFHQTVIDSQGEVVEEAEGVFMLRRPGQFRWDYEAPYQQHIVADGERVWFYDVDLQQVTVRSQREALADTPATLLSGGELPADRYTMQDLPSYADEVWVELLPQEDESGFARITLGFAPQGLRHMVMTDQFGQRTMLVFSAVEQNALLLPNLFEFTVPQGVDVVGDLAD